MVPALCEVDCGAGGMSVRCGGGGVGGDVHGRGRDTG